MEITYALTASQIMELTALQNQKRHPDAYRFVRHIAIQASTIVTSDEERRELNTVAIWMDRAASINANDGTFSSEFVRGATEIMGAMNNNPISDDEFQDASNKLGAVVIQKILDIGGIPNSEVIISRDVATAVENLHLPKWGWAGTIGDILPISIGGLGQDFVALPTTDARAMGEAYAKALAANGYGVGRWITSQLPSPFSGAVDLANLGGDYDQIGNFITELQNQYQLAKETASPLILDLDGDGIETLSTSAGIHFDHDGNHFAETTGWVGKDDGLLVWDRNGNGVIDNGGELFGNNTLLNNGSKAANGFAALAELDANKDGKVDANDTAFTQLRLWKDSDSNAVIADGELFSLEVAGVRSIGINYLLQNVTDAQGNHVRQVGTYTKLDGKTSAINDVWFAADTVHALDLITVAISDDIASLPDLPGFGSVHSLHQAMALDESGKLKDLVTALASEKNVEKSHALMQDILFCWTSSSDYAANSRGIFFPDARKLFTLEAFLGEQFMQGYGINVGTPMPGPQASSALMIAYNLLSDRLYGQFIAQTSCKDLYDTIGLSWDMSSGTFKLDVTATVLALQTAYEIDAGNTLSLIADFGYALKYSGNFGTAVLEAISQQGDRVGFIFSRSLATIGWNYLNGDDQNNRLFGDIRKDNLILGLGGDDVITGGNVNDLIVGCIGNDTLKGGLGNDLYRFSKGDGVDHISETDFNSGNLDTVQFLDVASTELTSMQRINNNLVLLYGSNDQLIVDLYFNGSYARIEKIAFADGVSWDEAAIKAGVMTVGTAGADLITGYDDGVNRMRGLDGNDTLYGGSKDDQLDGGNGNDVLLGYGGNDTLLGGAGNDSLEGDTGKDILNGGFGNDTLMGGAGNDTYLFAKGDGSDSLTDSDSTISNIDTVQLLDVASTEPITLQRNGYDLAIKYGNSDQLSVVNYFNSAKYRIEKFTFSDGVSWDDAVIKARVMTVGTAGANYIYGYDDGTNRIAGLDGNDTIYGGSKDDQIDGGEGNDFITSYDGNDLLAGGFGNDSLYGGIGNDSLLGGEGDDMLSGGDGNDLLDAGTGAGNDVMDGGSGNDTYILRGSGVDRVIDNGGGFDVLQLIDVLSTDIKGIQRLRDDLILNYGSGDQLTINNYFRGPYYRIEQIIFADGLNWDDDFIKSRVLTTGTNNGDYIYGYNDGCNRIVGYDGNDSIYGGSKDDQIDGGNGNDTLYGYSGNDILQGKAGSDILNDTFGNNLFDGGADNDTLNGGAGNEFFIGGTGNDTITTGTGADIIAFNRGDGQDTVMASIGKDNTLSLGNGIRYEDLQFSKIANDLILATGVEEKITLNSWYLDKNCHSIAILQMVTDSPTDYDPMSSDPLRNKEIQQFNFEDLVASFDHAQEALAGINPWSLMNSLQDQHRIGIDSAAMGGDLAYWYGNKDSLAGMSMWPPQNLLASGEFGAANQTFLAPNDLKILTTRLV